jgi:LPS-assembly lipoprotein
MTRMSTRRIAIAASLLLYLSGCGFHPLYGQAGTPDPALQSVFVDVIANRNGQLLRQALQERLDGPDNVAKKYQLSVFYAVANEAIGVQSDNSVDRNRIVGTANWTLKMPGPFGTKVISGLARQVDGANVIDAQFFYSDLASEAISKRIGDALADQIVQSLAVYFRTHPKAA